MDNDMQQSKAVTTSESNPAIDATFEAPSASKRHEKNTNSGVSWGFLFNLIFILLLLFATSTGGFYLYQELTAQREQANQLAKQLQQRLDDPISRLTHLEMQQRNAERDVSNKLESLTNTQSQLHEQVTKLAEQNPSQWMAEEAQYLVRMAGNKLWLENDPQTALALLKTADARILAIKDPALTPLRKALADDMAQVASIKTTDVAGTVLTLDSMIDNLAKLKLNRAEPEITPDDSLAMSDSLQDWQSNLTKSWKALLNEFVVIRKRTTDNAPLLAPDQQWYLVENIRNKLLQAQLALFRQDQVNYRNSVRMARKWIYQYFNLKDNKTKQTITELDALATLELQVPAINQFAATPLLQQLVNHGSLVGSQEKPL
ncbi:uroporphyrinogen-III C-methyltransferase [Shewanella sp. AS1]|uniref:uroporphyrinogen-III C-methyltransferase n=1 Tax=Shewanella sp. AS1 TaxID=2907626 RepID=UPI001F2F922D|nr:uroporphyrinogen-III C-methyltransferase [Shewanella sp. AS1]MCE9680454.1 uroporphyrinogen-III C-methyltransferase [Shewanella sp. AS1]